MYTCVTSDEPLGMAAKEEDWEPTRKEIDEFCSITDATNEMAVDALKKYPGNFELAVTMFLEEQEASSSSGIREPIPPQQEVLVDTSQFQSYVGRAKRPSHSVFDSFRDFQVETRRQEEMLSGGSSMSKRRNLEDLFRPPLDLMFHGTFQDARDVGMLENKWLMVNVQNVMEFSCQILNRDIWSKEAIKNIISEHFIFWQVLFDSVEGQRYSSFYKITDWPYVAVLDPRTGECLKVWNKIDVISFSDNLLEFLNSGHSLQNPNKRAKFSDSSQNAEIPMPSTSGSTCDGQSQDKNRSFLQAKEVYNQEGELDYDEAEQLAAAIQLSLAEEVNGNGTQQETMCSSNSDSHTEEKTDPVQIQLGNSSERQITIVFRYPDGSREQLVAPESAELKVLTSYLASKGFPRERYKMLIYYPRLHLSDLNDTVTLKNLGLHDQETVFVHEC